MSESNTSTGNSALSDSEWEMYQRALEVASALQPIVDSMEDEDLEEDSD
jgi:hypothetical protein